MINGESPEGQNLNVSDCVGDGLSLFVDESAGEITCEVDTAEAGTPQTYPAGLTGDPLSGTPLEPVTVSDCTDGPITLIDGETGGITCEVKAQVDGTLKSPAGLTGDTLLGTPLEPVTVSDCTDGPITLIDGQTGGITCEVKAQVDGTLKYPAGLTGDTLL